MSQNVEVKCYHNVNKCHIYFRRNVTFSDIVMLTNVTKMLQMTAQMSPFLNTQLQQWTLLSPYKFQVNFFEKFPIINAI